MILRKKKFKLNVKLDIFMLENIKPNKFKAILYFIYGIYIFHIRPGVLRFMGLQRVRHD